MSEEDEAIGVAIDNGSSLCKIGFAGNEIPDAVFSAVVGRPRARHLGHGRLESYVGDKAQSERDILSLKYPIERGIVTNWDDMENIWDYAFNKKLRVDSSKHSVVITEAVLNPMLNREKMAQIMFETFETPELGIFADTLPAFYSAGRSVGVSVICGDGLLQVMPIYLGYIIANATRRLELAGTDVTDYLLNILNVERGYSFATTSEREIVREMKEEFCYVALDFEREMATATESVNKTHDLSSGQSITIGKERFRCPEIFFQPSLLGDDVKYCGIHEVIYNSIMTCDIDIRSHMFCNIIICGGTTMLPGFVERLEKEIKALAPKNVKVKVVAGVDRRFDTWVGCSMLGSCKTFCQEMFFSKQEYEEIGPEVVHPSVLRKTLEPNKI